MFLLFGAEFTQAWATERGRGVRPEEGAVRVIERQVQVGPGRPAEGKDGSDVAATERAPSRRGKGGFGDWLVGLPVLYLLFRQRSPQESASSRRKAPSR